MWVIRMTLYFKTVHKIPVIILAKDVIKIQPIWQVIDMGHGQCISYLRVKDASAPGLPCIHLKVSSFLYQIVHLKYASHNLKQRPLSHRPLKQTGNLLVCVCGESCSTTFAFVRLRSSLLLLWPCCEFSWVSVNVTDHEQQLLRVGCIFLEGVVDCDFTFVMLVSV